MRQHVIQRIVMVCLGGERVFQACGTGGGVRTIIGHGYEFESGRLGEDPQDLFRVSVKPGQADADFARSLRLRCQSGSGNAGEPRAPADCFLHRRRL